MGWLIFVAGAILSWGAYGVLLAPGPDATRQPVEGAALRRDGLFPDRGHRSGDRPRRAGQLVEASTRRASSPRRSRARSARRARPASSTRSDSAASRSTSCRSCSAARPSSTSWCRWRSIRRRTRSIRCCTSGSCWHRLARGWCSITGQDTERRRASGFGLRTSGFGLRLGLVAQVFRPAHTGRTEVLRYTCGALTTVVDHGKRLGRSANHGARGNAAIERGEAARHLLRQPKQIDIADLPVPANERWVEYSPIAKRNRIRPEDVMSAVAEHTQTADYLSGAADGGAVPHMAQDANQPVFRERAGRPTAGRADRRTNRAQARDGRGRDRTARRAR